MQCFDGKLNKLRHDDTSSVGAISVAAIRAVSWFMTERYEELVDLSTWRDVNSTRDELPRIVDKYNHAPKPHTDLIFCTSPI